MNGPPRLAVLLLRLAIRNTEVLEAILGDLEEEFSRLLETTAAPSRPRFWYWGAILGLWARFALESLPMSPKLASSSPVAKGRERRPMFEPVVQDLRYALRGLRKSAGFTTASILTLTVGIGANVAMLSIIEPALLRPLAFEESEDLVLALGTVEGESWTQTVSAHDYTDLRDGTSVFESLSAQTAWPWISSLTGGDEPLRRPVAWVSTDLFRTLRVDPVLGRSFAADEGSPGAPDVAMVSHALWQQNFGSDPELVGRPIYVDGTSVTIVGVLPPGLRIWQDADVWLPMRLGEGFAEDRRYQNFVMIGRLRPGVPMEQAQSQADVIGAELATEYPATNGGEGFRLTKLQEAVTESYRTSLLLLMGGVGLLLLVACGNLAALLLARGFGRKREFSVRVALGGSRSRILGQVLTESLVVSLAGGLLGTAVAMATHGLLVARLPFSLPAHASQAGLSLPVLGFALLLSAGTGALIGVIPALRSARQDAVEGLKVGSRSGDLRGTRVRSGLVVAQVALSMVLLIASGLLIRSFVHLRGVDPGFDTQGLLAADLELPHSAYPDLEARRIFATRLEETVRAIPGVSDVAIIDRLPIRAMGGNTYVYPVGQEPPAGEQARTANERRVMSGYFQAMGMPILRGRAIEATDGPGAPPVLVINETMAREFFPGQDPLGERVIIDYDDATPLEIVGVVGDVRFDGPAHGAFQAMYHSYLQEPGARLELGIRVAGDASGVVAGLRAAVRNIDPYLPISEVERMDQVLARTMGDQSVMAAVLSLFAWVAVLLTALGLYGVLAYYVSQRVPEIGLRMALGAGSGTLIRQVTGRGLALLGSGTILGLIGALGATRLLERLLFGVQPTDPTTFLATSAFFLSVGAVACILPARRIVRVDPVKALNAE